MSFVFAASPFWLGGFISINGAVVEYFSSALTPFDCNMFNAPLGDAVGQQTWEALALLVGLKLWLPMWKSQKVAVAIEGDNVGALTLIAKFKAAGKGLGMIARDMGFLFL